jgi:hypothetical protein
VSFKPWIFREAWPKGSLEGPVYVKVTLELSMSDTEPATPDLVLLDFAIPRRREGGLLSHLRTFG